MIRSMATQFSMLGIINAALLAQGQDQVSENDGSHEWLILSQNWPSIVEAELEDGNYHFTRRQDTLTTPIAGKFGFKYGYQISLDVLHVRRIWIEDSLGDRTEPDWTQDGSAVYLDDNVNLIIAEVLVSSEPDLWKANFVRGVQMKMEAVILRAVKEEFSEAGAMEQQAEVYFQRARVSSTRSKSPHTPYRKGPIAKARSRRGPR